jgi:hypothetical protein
MTTAIKMEECPTSKMRTELVCPCGKRLSVSVQSLPEGGIAMKDLQAVAGASKWKICEDYIQKLGEVIDAFCPNCHS